MPSTMRSIFAVVGLFAVSVALVQSGGAAWAKRRAAPPRSWPPDVLDAFFADATAALLGDPPSTVATRAAPPRKSRATGRVDARTGSWSALISGETIEDEIKLLRIDLGRSLTNRDRFEAGAYQECRRDLGNLAVLLAVVARYDGPIRWKQAAALLWARFARAAHGSTEGTGAAYRAARARLGELDNLVRGEPVAAAAEGQPVLAPFADFVERPLLMQRMKRASRQRIAPYLASERDFRRSREKLAHEGAILALLAEIIQRPAMEYADDDGYAEPARQLRQAGLDMVAASEQNNYRAARRAAAKATRACSDCHDGYRE